MAKRSFWNTSSISPISSLVGIAALLLVAGACDVSVGELVSSTDDGFAGSLRLSEHEAVSGVRACASGETLPGIDVSHWQGEIDWAAVKADGVEFAFIRVSDGLSVEDTQFDNNWEGARANDIARGVYQFFRPSLSGTAQADLLIDRVGSMAIGDLPPVLDLEVMSGQTVEVVLERSHEWIDRVVERLGVRPILYVSPGFWYDIGEPQDLADKVTLWVANWDVECPTLPEEFPRWDFWQTSDRGSVAGIQGDVDLNTFNGGRLRLDDLRYMPRCGDGICHVSEGACSEDCDVVCEPIDAERVTTLEEANGCVTIEGAQRYWRDEQNVGSADRLLWSNTWVTDEPHNVATWNIRSSGVVEAEVEVYVDGTLAEATSVIYQVQHRDGTSTVDMDQSNADGWVNIGTYSFDGNDGYVQVVDSVTDVEHAGKRFVVDAIRILPIEVETPEPDVGPEPDIDPRNETPEDRFYLRPVPNEDSRPREVGSCQSTASGAWIPFGILILGFVGIRRRR